MVERQPSKLGVAGSSPVSRSIFFLTRVQPLSTPSAFARFLRFLASLANSVKARKEVLWMLYLEDFLLSGRVEGRNPALCAGTEKPLHSLWPTWTGKD